MSSGIGAIIGAFAWGWFADRIGRRKVFIGTVLNFSIATGLLYFTPDNGWIYLTIMRFFVGVGVGGLYCVDPAAGAGVHAVLQARLGWRYRDLRHSAGHRPRRRARRLHRQRRLAAAVRDRRAALAARAAGSHLGAGIAALALPPGRYEEARASLAWALQMEPSALPMPTAADAGADHQKQLARPLQISAQLIVSWLGNAGAQTGVYGLTLWVPSLFVLLLKVTPQEAAKMMIL